jgi:hypothetical protein
LRGSQPPLEETPGAAQPRLAARRLHMHLYDVVPRRGSSLDLTFEDAEDEVINLIWFTIIGWLFSNLVYLHFYF